MDQRLPKTIRSRIKGLLGTGLLLGTGALAAGCSSSSNDDALAEFEGTWRIETNSVTSLACPASTLLLALPLWDKVTLERGAASDLTEISGPDNCQLPFDVSGKSASVPATDPYTSKPVTCETYLGPSGDGTVDFFLDLFPTHWDFNLLAPVKGQAPTAQLQSTAPSTFSRRDSTTGAVLTSDKDCSYTMTLNLTKIAK